MAKRKPAQPADMTKQLSEALGLHDGVFSWDDLIKIVHAETTAHIVTYMLHNGEVCANDNAYKAYKAVMGKERKGRP